MLSLPKLLLLLVVGAVVWYGWRIWQRKIAAAAGSTPAQPSDRKADDLVKCPRCGTYVAAGSAHDCAG